MKNAALSDITFQKDTMPKVSDLTLPEVRKGHIYRITGFSDDSTALRLTELGCPAGSLVQLRYTAPLGDPLAIKVLSGSLLSIRKKEAACIMVEPLKKK